MAWGINSISLLDRLKEVEVGDLITLQSLVGQAEASGYVVRLDKDFVRLSHEHPKNRHSVFPVRRKGFTKGDRTYRLDDFSAYQIRLKAKASRIMERVEVAMGDLVVFENIERNVEVAGYIRELDKGEVRLSFEFPGWQIPWTCPHGRVEFTRGDKSYDFRDFLGCRIIQDSDEKRVSLPCF